MMIEDVEGTLIKIQNDRPKYSLLENERKWLVSRDVTEDFQEAWHYLIIDRYIEGTRIRLREARDSETKKSIYKLTKKYGGSNLYSEPLASFYISKTEYDLFSKLPSRIIQKRRFRFPENGYEYSIDIFEKDNDGLVLCEIESSSESELLKIPEPSISLREVTKDEMYFGSNLAK